MYSIETIAEVIGARVIRQVSNSTIAHLAYDSRSISFAASSIFFAIRTKRQDGHRFLGQAYQKGIRNFVVDQDIDETALPEANILRVHSSVKALQQLAVFHREQFTIPVIGITGSNGKTVVKEWLYQLLQEDHHIVRSPKSYNSQIGVAMSLWQMKEGHDLAIFEAGISQPGEMDALEEMIRPTLGVLTNIGSAHDEGFSSTEQKLEEKLKLFRRADVVIGEEKWISNTAFKKKFMWGQGSDCRLRVVGMERESDHTVLKGYYLDYPTQLTMPFTDDASIQNAITCWSVLLVLDYNEQDINARFRRLHQVDMRLEMKQGINGCVIINDSYSADLTSFHMALHFMNSQQGSQKKTAILSDFMETGKTGRELYGTIAESLAQHGVGRVIAIGKNISEMLPRFLPEEIRVDRFDSTREFIDQMKTSAFQQETILVKGARVFNFESVVQLLEKKLHQTVLEINLNALAANLKSYQHILQPRTRLMAMVKAFAYGSGGVEIASVLQYNQVDYLAVAYTDEAVELRRSGIHMPIMVMNMEPSSFAAITDHQLQPVIYSFKLLEEFDEHLRNQALTDFPVHIEVETGMNRLGFATTEMEKLGEWLVANETIRAESVFTHLAASDDEAQDEFTRMQAGAFLAAVDVLDKHLNYPFIRHIGNTAAITRFPEYHLDMVRVGIGLYGVETAGSSLDLEPVATLRSTISQVKRLKAGDTVSYNRSGVIKEDSVIATVRIGYADGYSRRLGNGVGKMWVRGKLVPVTGTVCMDMTMIDVTSVPGVEEGDEVIVFGAELSVQQLAEWAGTIPYEILTSVSQRVKRVYFQE